MLCLVEYTTGRYSEQPAHTSQQRFHGKMDVKIFLMFIVAENTRSVNIQVCTWNLFFEIWHQCHVTPYSDGHQVWEVKSPKSKVAL